mmetsp:Transcript_2679/g.7990  ORF Transcript_2679/g.7990 Transcript_2679/m.7990 type:complete len:212 (-) Transcript_2679:2666-3301(-)
MLVCEGVAIGQHFEVEEISQGSSPGTCVFHAFRPVLCPSARLVAASCPTVPGGGLEQVQPPCNLDVLPTRAPVRRRLFEGREHAQGRPRELVSKRRIRRHVHRRQAPADGGEARDLAPARPHRVYERGRTHVVDSGVKSHLAQDRHARGLRLARKCAHPLACIARRYKWHLPGYARACHSGVQRCREEGKNRIGLFHQDVEGCIRCAGVNG